MISNGEEEGVQGWYMVCDDLWCTEDIFIPHPQFKSVVSFAIQHGWSLLKNEDVIHQFCPKCSSKFKPKEEIKP